MLDYVTCLCLCVFRKASFMLYCSNLFSTCRRMDDQILWEPFAKYGVVMEGMFLSCFSFYMDKKMLSCTCGQ
jgi:hypothetical protein